MDSTSVGLYLIVQCICVHALPVLNNDFRQYDWTLFDILYPNSGKDVVKIRFDGHGEKTPVFTDSKVFQPIKTAISDKIIHQLDDPSTGKPSSHDALPVGPRFGSSVFVDPRSRNTPIPAGPILPEIANLGDKIREKARNGGYGDSPLLKLF